MSQELFPPDLKWPRWQWWFNFWLSLIPFILGFIIFFFPQLAEGRLKVNRLAVGISLLLAPIIIPTFVWLWRAGRIAYLRGRYYPHLILCIQQNVDELDGARKSIFSLLEVVTRSPAFEILRARYYQEKLFIVLRKQKSQTLAQGNKLVVVHTNEQRPMGEFIVSEVRVSEYYAVGEGNIDSKWLDDVRQKGEVATLPYMAAILVPQKGKRQ